MKNTKPRPESNRFKAIKSCFDICVKLQYSWQKQYLSQADVAHEATHVFKRTGITPDAISRWVRSFDEKTGLYKPARENVLTEENILWLCHRHGINVKIDVSVNDDIRMMKKLIANADKFDPNNIYKK